MDGELLRHLYHELFHRGNLTRPRRCDFCDEVVLFIYLLAVLRNRSPHWACDKRNWLLWARRLPCPSYSQLMRRLKTDSVHQGIYRLNTTLRSRLPRTAEKAVDGKPLVVGGYSKDPDARWGQVPPHGWACGYKLHAVVDSAGAIEVCTVTPLNGGESSVARQLVQGLDLRGALVRGDSNYDSNLLYAAIARRGGRLLAPRKRPGTALGHRPHHADRLRAVAELEHDPQGLPLHRRLRNRAEQAFAHLTNLPYGLSPLPNFVRRQERVSRWVQAKITLYHLHLALRQAAAHAA